MGYIHECRRTCSDSMYALADRGLRISYMTYKAFVEVNRRFYGRKFRFTATLTRRRKTKFPTVKPPRRRKTKFPTVKPPIYLHKRQIWGSYPHSNAFIHFFYWKNVLFAQNDKRCELRKTKCQPMRSDVTWWRRICDSISQNIPSQIFDVIQSDVALHRRVH